MQNLIAKLQRLSGESLTQGQLLALTSSDNLFCGEVLALIEQQRRKERVTGFAHQLGFFKFTLAVVNGKFPRTLRLHYWRRAEVQDDIHDHISSLASRVLHGALSNRFYEKSDGKQQYALKKFNSIEGCCKPASHNAVRMESLRLVDEAVLTAGQSYFLKYDQLHGLLPISDELVTLIVQDAPVEREINVYQRAGNALARSGSAIPLTRTESLKIFSRIEELLGGSI